MRDDNQQAGQPLILASPRAPLEVARQFVVAHCHRDGALTLRRWRNGWWTWRGTHWEQCPADELRKRLYAFTENAYYHSKRDGVVKWMPDKSKINALVDALAASECHTNDKVEPPCWIGRPEVAPGTVIACRNGLLDIHGRVMSEHTPLFFNLMALPFDYDTNAPEPEAWLKFLSELWPEDRESIRALRQIFGYVVSGRTDLQKIFALIGPPRGGKGIIAKVLSGLIGDNNVAGPTLASLSERFGLAPLIGKSLAVVADARIAGKNVQTLVERLLAISGEDRITVDIKYDTEGWTGKMSARLLLLSNELPQLGDASTAVAGRFLLLMLTQSWLGREDIGLAARLRGELPGILNWSLDGLDDLGERGRFTHPATGEEALQQLIELSSPVRSFVDERCEVGPGFRVPTLELYSAYGHWADYRGYPKIADNTFGKNLKAAFPKVRIMRPRSKDDRFHVYAGLRLRSGHGRGENAGMQALSELLARKPLKP